MVLGILLGCCSVAFALDPSLDVSQYAHTSWTVRDGFSLGNVYAMAQTPDGYLWFGTEFGLFRFDGVHSASWQPPAGQYLPVKDINSLLVARDGTLWIGTFAGLATLKDGKLTQHPELGRHFVASLFEDREGTVWVGILDTHGRLCAIRSDSVQCFGEDAAFGRAVWATYEDSSGALWAAAQSGLWRMKPGPPKRYATTSELIALNKADDGRLLIAMHGAGLLQLAGDKVESYPVRSTIGPNRLLQDRDLDSNRMLRDRDGGLWIGTVDHGLIHVHNGRTDVYTKLDGLSGDVILSVFEDREGDVWVASTGGLDRFRELPVSTISVKQGLASDATQSVLAAADGAVWIGSHDGVTRLQNRQTTIFRTGSGLPEGPPQSLFQDAHGRIWVSAGHELAYFKNGSFTTASSVPGGIVHYIAGDRAGNLWLSGRQDLLHLREGRLVEQIPWKELGRSPSAEVLLSDPEQGGVWLGFWDQKGVLYFKDGRVRKSYTPAEGLGEGFVPSLQLDQDRVLWVATQNGGLSRIKDDRIATLSTRNGLPCNAIYWALEDDDHSLWLYTACGLVRIVRSELNAWIADPKLRIETTVWDAADGVRLRSGAATEYGPREAKSIDGKLWFVTGEGVQVVDPRHLAINNVPPPVHIERIVADHKTYWQNITGTAISSLHLPALTRDLTIDYTALSLVAPEKVHFKYKLEGQDPDWREVVNNRQVQYSNLAPGAYRFRVIACNNSGVWNQQGDTLELSVAPAYYQTNWFILLCAAALLFLLWALFRLRSRQLAQEFNRTLEARVSERTSIARDLHDTLLQSFHGLLLRFQMVDNLLPDRPVEAKERLAQAINQATEAVTQGRDAVEGLRSSTVETNDLGLAVTTLCEELAADESNHSSAVFSVAVEGTPRNLHPILRDEVYRIAGEALRNAFRHARARQIEVEFRYDDRQLRLRVRDDGKGIDPEVLNQEGRQGHYGLFGMRERAKLVGGKLEVWSQIDSGTEVELSIPVSIAYATNPARHHFWLATKLLDKLSGKGRR